MYVVALTGSAMSTLIDLICELTRPFPRMIKSRVPDPLPNLYAARALMVSRQEHDITLFQNPSGLGIYRWVPRKNKLWFNGTGMRYCRAFNY